MATATSISMMRGGGSVLLSCCYNSTAAATATRSLIITSVPSLISTKSPLVSIYSVSSLLQCSPITNASISFTTRPGRGGALRFCTAGGSAAATVADSSLPSPAESEAGAVKELANSLDIRVGKVLKAWIHPDADSLYVEEVDIGEPEPRTICSGLVNYVPLDHLQDKLVVVLANLKPRNMRGVKSCGMLMAASDASHENVELLVPPEAALPGDRIWFGSEDDKERQPAPATPNQVQKKKIWESVQPHLKTDASRVALLYNEHPMLTSAGAVVSSFLANANIS